jgi:hypothetical protein
MTRIPLVDTKELVRLLLTSESRRAARMGAMPFTSKLAAEVLVFPHTPAELFP